MCVCLCVNCSPPLAVKATTSAHSVTPQVPDAIMSSESVSVQQAELHPSECFDTNTGGGVAVVIGK